MPMLPGPGGGHRLLDPVPCALRALSFSSHCASLCTVQYHSLCFLLGCWSCSWRFELPIAWLLCHSASSSPCLSRAPLATCTCENRLHILLSAAPSKPWSRDLPQEGRTLRGPCSVTTSSPPIQGRCVYGLLEGDARKLERAGEAQRGLAGGGEPRSVQGDIVPRLRGV